jgi:D-sedoheptulose 7-phosphate isomerase
MALPLDDRLSGLLEPLLGRAAQDRTGPGLALAGDADRIARAAQAMALRFHRGGKLLTFGNGGAAADAAHLAVEFVHPVIVGRRALPAISLAGGASAANGPARSNGHAATFAAQVRLLGRPEDIAVGVFGGDRCENVPDALAAARELGMLTIALAADESGRPADETDTAAEHLLTARSADPRIAREIHMTIYHVLWELVHVFFDRPGLLEASTKTPGTQP